jgi:hypothetical protein
MKSAFKVNYLLILLFLLPLIMSCSANAGTQGNGKAITEPEVKQYFTTLWASCASDTQCDIVFDTPVQIGEPVQHTSQTGMAVTSYPVQVGFTSSSYNKVFPVGSRVILYEYHKGGVYYFYRNAQNQWEMVKDGVDETSKMVKG